MSQLSYHQPHMIHIYQSYLTPMMNTEMTSTAGNERLHRILHQLHPHHVSGRDKHQNSINISINETATGITPSVLSSTSSSSSSLSASPRSLQRAVIVTGARTPFCKSFTDLISVDSIALAVSAVGGLIQHSHLAAHDIDQVILGNVVQNTAAPNVAREVILDLNLPKTIPGLTISIACLSGLEAVALAVAQIETGAASVIIAGGTDSTSNAEMPLPRQLTVALGTYQMGGGNKKGWTGKRELLANAGSPFSWFPSAPTVSERSTGKTMVR